MKKVAFSAYELGMLERYLKEYIELKQFKQNHRKSDRSSFNSIEYDKEQIRVLLERIRGKDYKPDYVVQTARYKESLYVTDDGMGE